MKIPDKLMQTFKSRAQKIEIEEEQKNPIPGADPESTGDPGEAAAPDLEILESLNDTLSWICSTADGMAKKQGFPGLGEVPPDQLGELLTIVAKRNLPGSVIEKSPETAVVAILGGIGVQNYLAYKNKLQEQKKQQSKSENKE